MARPDAFETRRRTARFLALVAQGLTLREAAKQACVHPDRALDLVQDRDEFDRQVQALRRRRDPGGRERTQAEGEDPGT